MIEVGGTVDTMLAAVALTLAYLPAPKMTTEKLSAFLRTECESHKLPAIAAGIVEIGKPHVLAVTGLRVQDGVEKVTIRDKFHIGSCTKSMTAVLCAMAVEKNQLRWDSTIGEVLKDVEVHPKLRGVTLAQLLSHRSGLRGDLDEHDMGLYMHSNLSPQVQRSEVIKKLLAEEPHHEPDSEFLYSNLGYSVIGAMLERVEGQPWEELMKRQLFKPLGMSSAGFGAPASLGKRDQPWGHQAGEDGKLTPIEPGPEADNPPALAPGATVHCSIGDQAKYAEFQLRAAKLISPKSFERMREDVYKQHYGWGWVVLEQSWTNGMCITHTGSNTMFNTMFWIVPGRNLAIVVSTNAGGDKALEACNNVVLKVVETLQPGWN